MTALVDALLLAGAALELGDTAEPDRWLTRLDIAPSQGGDTIQTG